MRATYFSKLGLKLVKAQLDTLFSAEVVDLAVLRGIARSQEIPSNFRERVWMHLLFGWTFSANVPFLRDQQRQKFEDLRRVSMAMRDAKSIADGKTRKRQQKRAFELLLVLKTHAQLSGRMFDASWDEIEGVLATVAQVMQEDAQCYFAVWKMLEMIGTKAEVTFCVQRAHVALVAPPPSSPNPNVSSPSSSSSSSSSNAQSSSAAAASASSSPSALVSDVVSGGESSPPVSLVKIPHEQQLRLWFRSFFTVSALTVRDILFLWDRLFAMEEREEQAAFLSAVAVGMLKWNTKANGTVTLEKLFEKKV